MLTSSSLNMARRNKHSLVDMEISLVVFSIEPTFDRYGCGFKSVSQGSLCARRVIVKREFLTCEV
jgi:hypothetical protein